MAQSAVLLALPTGKHTERAKDAPQQTASHLTQGLEDIHLVGRVERALHATGYCQLRRIEVTVQARMVILAGRVPSYYLKQVAQTAALGVPGIHHIQNNLQVV